MPYPTGATIYDHVVSVDQNNAAVSGATFDTVLFRNGATSPLSVTVALDDDVRGVFLMSFTPTLYGQYQLYAKNNSTGTIFMSDFYDVSTGNTTVGTVYIGI